MYTILTDPNQFFASEIEDGSLRWPLLLVWMTGILNAAKSILMTSKSLGVLENSHALITVTAFVGLFIGVLVSMLVWVLYTSIIYLVSNQFGGDGEFRELFRLVGWGYLPAVFGGLLSFLTIVWILRRVTVPASPTNAEIVTTTIKTSPEMQILTVVLIAFTLWQGYLWMFAVKHARNIPIRPALLSVAGPILVSILLTILL